MKTPTYYTEEQMNVVLEFIQKSFGNGEEVLVGHEIESEYVHTDVAVVTAKEGSHCFATFGMGAREMNAPIPQLARVELVMYASENFEPTSDEARILMSELQSLSKFPFANGTFLGPGHTIAASELFEETFGFEAFVFAPVEHAKIDDLGDVLFLLVIPIYEEERDEMIRGNSFDVIEQLEDSFGGEIYYADSDRVSLLV